MDQTARAEALSESAASHALQPLAPRAGRFALRPQFATPLILALGLGGLFLFSHPYRGIYNDGFLYALQALRRLDPVALGGDLFFRYGSQDRFTIFSPFYAAFIRWLGLEPAAWLFARTGAISLCVAAWLLARRLCGREAAWLAIALFVVVPGNYGSGLVFSYSEDFATPRVFAEALVLGSIALLVDGRRIPSLAALLVAFLVHPLMAFPGLLFFVLWVASRRVSTLFAAVVIAVLCAVTALAAFAPIGPLRFIDEAWRTVLDQRVGFLFPDQWALQDWQPTLSTFAVLASARVVLPDGVGRRIAGLVLLIAAGGLLIAGFASTAAPIALLVQGQPWRWLWLGRAIATLLLVPIGAALWRRGVPGRSVLALLVAASLGTNDPVGVMAAPCALLGVLVEVRGERRWAPACAWVAAALSLLVVWAMWRIDGLLSETPMVAAAIAVWFAAFRTTQTGLRAIAILASALLFSLQSVAAVFDTHRVVSDYPRFDEQTYRDFAPWRARIGVEQTVYFPAFPEMVWLLLHRRSFSGPVGLVFSREAALASAAQENLVRDWGGHDEPNRGDDASRTFAPLAFEKLRAICGEHTIDFVISPDLQPIRGLSVTAPFPFDGLHLYACTDVRGAG